MKKILTILAFSMLFAGVAVADDAPAASEEKVSFGASAYPSLGEVTCPRLNVRMLPSTESNSIIATILKGGAEVTVVSSEKGFFRILPPKGCTVWVYGRNIEKDGEIGTVTSDNTPLRIDSRVNARKVGLVNAGEKVRIVKEHMGWCRIQAPECVPYYVGSRYVRLTDKVAPEKVGLPSKVKEAAVVPTTDGDTKAMAAMKEAELLVVQQERLLAAKRILELDYRGVIQAYQRAADLAINGALKSRAKSEVSRYEQLQSTLHLQQVRIRGFEAEIRASKDAERARKLEKARPLNFIFTGYVKTVGKYAGRPGPFRLVMNGRTVCFLKPADDVNSGKLIEQMKFQYNELVGVCGTVVDDLPGHPGSKLVLVTSIEPLSDDAGE